MNCLSDGELREYLDEEIGAARRAEVEAHLAECVACEARLRKIRAGAERVRGAMMALDGSEAMASGDARAALARFSAGLDGARERDAVDVGRFAAEVEGSLPAHDTASESLRAEQAANRGVPRVAGAENGAAPGASTEIWAGNAAERGGNGVIEMTKESMAGKMFGRRWRPAWITAVAASILLCSLAFPSGRSLAQRFLATLRIEKVQPVRLDFSSLDGNKPLQEMFRQMISDKVVVTADEKSQAAGTAQDAGQLAGFPVRVLGARTDAPKFTVEGQHAFHMTVDRSRLQDIFDQAGRPDLLLPATIDGAQVSVNVPRGVRVEYGDCPHHREAADATQHSNAQAGANGAWSNCLALVETPSPQVNMPADLNIQQLAEITFQLSGMSATQARELGQSIDWKSTLVLPMPRFAGSYSQVQVGGVQGTLISNSNGGGRRGPDYVLIWVKNGIIYGLVGHGEASNAVAVANSLS
jgi:hypothetical protein